MARAALIERTLPLDLPVPVAHPFGEVYDPKRPYTLPMTQRVALARIVGNYTEIDRKLWATLVSHAWDDLAKKSIHEANARSIAKLFRELKGGQSGSDWIMESAKRLMKLTLEWEEDDAEDDPEIGATNLLSGLKIKKVSGAIFYSFSDFLIEKLLDNQKFSRVRLHFMIGLSGKYSVTLYMLLEGAANLRKPVVELPIDELRKVLSVPEGKLSRWVDLNRFAIEPAVRQINENSAAAGFSVEVAAIMKGRKFEAVRFTVTKAALRVEHEGAIQANRLRISHREADGAAAPGAAPAYDIEDAIAIVRKHAPREDAYGILAEFEASVKSSKEKIMNPLGALTNFAKKKYKDRKKARGGLFDEAAE